MNQVHPINVSADQFSDGPVAGRLSDCLSLANDQLGRSIKSFLDRYESRAIAGGIRLELHTDFQQFKATAASLNKGPISPQFDQTVSDIGAVNGFWLKGVDGRGEIAQLQAVRMDDLDGDSLANHCRSLRFFYDDPSVSAHPGESCVVDAPASNGISGVVCYQGEFWIKGGENGFRGHDFAKVLLRIGMAIALARWSPDFIFATVAPVLVEKGVVARYGYHNLQPHGMIWTAPQNDEVLDEWIMWLAWRELVDLVARSR
ncbi:MAG: hypothetical protein HN644_06935 [Rhodospirillales bacterium]|nr:hypothetical protein [Rhodospirillales bacterium]MBT4040136.1 hypothetical protein [Rhodospirillales bacterium]MBT4625467.1 hypothetical protein [Rhodospirillales bacterium]MBT5352105.1 hypothetical protein [Rhodospirillales bacterium]MBT5521874.1 hypothetical protein [Rhodospirillales bacterium]